MKKYQSIEVNSINDKLEWREVHHTDGYTGTQHLMFEKGAKGRLVGIHDVPVGQVYLAEEFVPEFGEALKADFSGYKTKPFSDLLILLGNSFVSASNKYNEKPVDAKPTVETCFHLGAKIFSRDRAVCQACNNNVDPHLVMANLSEQMSNAIELFWAESAENKAVEQEKQVETKSAVEE